MLKIFSVIALSYLIGSFSTSFFIGKILNNVDIRNYGSGNAGATNALRVFGKKVAFVTFVIDSLKGALAVYFGLKMIGYDGSLIGGIFVIIGHNWPLFTRFKGGKGVATTIGVVMSIEPLIAIIIIFIGIIILIKTRYVSLSAIVGMILLPFIGILIKGFDLYFIIFTLIVSIMAIYRHRSNIVRLINGNESKVGQRV